MATRDHKHLNAYQTTALHEAIKRDGLRSLSRSLDVHHSTITRAAAGRPVGGEIISKLARITARVRVADEFAEIIRSEVRAPAQRQSNFSWSIAKIRDARDAQMRGDFALPVQLATASRSDDAIFVARNNRLAPQNCIEALLVAAPGARGEGVLAKAQARCFTPRPVIAGILGTLVDHGIAIGYNEHEVDSKGTCVDFRLVEWPLEYVKWNAGRRRLETRTANGCTEEIVHGNGRWTVFRKFAEAPWTQEACLMAAAMVWAAHAEGLGDWSAGSRAHGLAQITGQMPEGRAIVDRDGALTKEAQAFLKLLQEIASGDAGAGIIPAGAKLDFLANGSTAWQVYRELILNREKAAARIYQGTDAALGAAGGAPGVDISALFDVASTKIQGDFEAIEAGLATGFYQPWCAVNEGSSQYAPALKYQIPDPDAAAKSEESSKGYVRLLDTVKGMREQRFEVTQDTVAQLAKAFRVHPVPVLASADTTTSTLILAPASLDVVVRGREARASANLPPFGDYRDEMTLDLLKAHNAAQADAIVKATPAAPAAAEAPTV